MTEEEKRSRNFSVTCGFISFCSILLLCVTTEIILDASIVLENIPLFLLIISVIPFITITMKDNKIRNVISMLSCIFIILDCLHLFSQRNKVEKVYFDYKSINEKMAQSILNNMKNSYVLVIATSKDIIIPQILEKYTILKLETKLQLLKRMNKMPEHDELEKDLTFEKVVKIKIGFDDLKLLRFSGLQRNMLLMINSEKEAPEDYEQLGFRIFSENKN